ncbi:hypothetical protein RM555_23705 [Micromonospora sp. DSM 115977]|uniref:Asparagine synthase n=2 Tax=Micromonospora reichwaldensis TaxID=3075516 RepID=A0ABU2X1E7_9ACTN|nr:hypothetical protein [Micromonospora sp. DSM 115977]
MAEPASRPLPSGVRVEHGAGSFTLRREAPCRRPLYYRLDFGRLEWSDDLSDFVVDGERPVPDPGLLLTLIQGGSPAPDGSPLDGVRRLTVGTQLRVTRDGISLTRRATPPIARPTGLLDAVTAALPGSGRYAIAYSGGLGSAFLAATAVAAGHRPVLVHADLGWDAGSPLPDIPGLAVERVRVDPDELLGHHGNLDGLTPPVPDVDVPQRVGRILAAHVGLPLVDGGLLEDLVSVRLPDLSIGLRGRRLLSCEPFHIAGTLRTLAQARELLTKAIVYVPERSRPRGEQGATPTDVVVPPSPNIVSAVPGITDTGTSVLESTHRGTMALWKEHLDFLGPVLARATAGAEERGAIGQFSPALDPGVLAAVARLAPGRIGRLRHGTFQNHLPLREPLSRLGVTGFRRTAPGTWLRRVTAVHLHRQRRAIAAEWERGSALADLGLIDVHAVRALLRDGRSLADNALPVLRILSIDRWLRGVA